MLNETTHTLPISGIKIHQEASSLDYDPEVRSDISLYIHVGGKATSTFGANLDVESLKTQAKRKVILKMIDKLDKIKEALKEDIAELDD